MRAWAAVAAVSRAASLGVAVFLATSLASAEPSEQDKALATTLFNDAKLLLAQDRTAEACRKLEESRRLNPLSGTVLNLAVCHEKEGRLASAFSEFREARVMAERDHRDDRVALADEHLATIEPQIPKLVIVVGAGADVPQVQVKRDGTPLRRAAWSTPTPVDPGDHVIEVSAPGKKTVRATITIARSSDIRMFTIASLEDAPATSTPQEPVSETTNRESVRGGISTRRKIALAVGGLAVAAGGVGTIFGVRAISRHGDPDATCSTIPCSDASVTLNHQAAFAADASTVSFAIAAVALSVSAVLWFTDSRAAAPRAALARGWTLFGVP